MHLVKDRVTFLGWVDFSVDLCDSLVTNTVVFQEAWKSGSGRTYFFSVEVIMLPALQMRTLTRIAVRCLAHSLPYVALVCQTPSRSQVKTPPTCSSASASAMTTATIVIDHGSGYVKSGFSGWNEPQMVVPSIVNYSPCRENPGPSYARRRLGLGIDLYHPDTYSYPVQRGRVLNWEGVECLWSFVLEKHRQRHEDCSVLVTESPLREPADRKKTLEVMFESLCVPSLLLADQLEMSLYASGLLTGVVLDSGHGLTRVQPFYLGRPLQPSCKALEFAGQDLATYICKSLFMEEGSPNRLFRMDTVNTIQMSKCYVPQNLGEALDLRQRNGSDESNTFRLPDGTSVELTPMQRVAPEMFFSPQVFDMQGPSLSQAVVDSIKACEAPLQPLLTSHVMACGGNTLYPGFTKRLYKELVIDHFSSANSTVWVGSKRNFSVWLGASVVAHLSSYKSEWMSKEEYDER
ncbi:actin-like protein 8 isoform X1 [Saccopteryx bilineata]|uniref:actin-like protein 8 isoform X1 n=3 Tax=Saccopteryx bilineata TaxID=59482 RepID=UPI00338E21FF